MAVNETRIARKLNCVIVDDDRLSAEILKDTCRDSAYTGAVQVFSSSERFLIAEPRLDFDICLLDINMPGISGLDLARRLKHRHIIFISGQYDKLKDALDMLEPIDVVPKPVNRERLNRAFEKAYIYMQNNKIKKEYKLFSALGYNGRVRIWLDDIVYAKADERDHRNKQIALLSGEQYTIMNCTFTYLLEICPALLQVNKSELISPHIFHGINYDTATLKELPVKNIPRIVTVSRTYKKKFIASVLAR